MYHSSALTISRSATFLAEASAAVNVTGVGLATRLVCEPLASRGRGRLSGSRPSVLAISASNHVQTDPFSEFHSNHKIFSCFMFLASLGSSLTLGA